MKGSLSRPTVNMLEETKSDPNPNVNAEQDFLLWQTHLQEGDLMQRQITLAQK